jgi:hypothetical protein
VYMYINGDKCCQVMAVTHDHDPLSQVWQNGIVGGPNLFFWNRLMFRFH